MNSSFSIFLLLVHMHHVDPTVRHWWPQPCKEWKLKVKVELGNAGILHKGDGTNIYLKQRPRRVTTVLGDGKARRVDCRGCNGRIDETRLMAPVALASGRDGSLYIGDYNFIRKLESNREEVASILQLRCTALLLFPLTIDHLSPLWHNKILVVCLTKTC